MGTYRLIVGMAILLWPAVAEAGVTAPPKGPETNWSISFFLGAATYAMDDLNAVIDQANQAYGSELVDLVDHGIELGGCLAVEIAPRWQLGLAYTTFNASSGYGPLAGSGDEVDIYVKGRTFEVQARYMIHTGPRISWGVGAALGLLRGSGSIEGHENDTYINYTFEGDGDGPTLAANAAVEYSLSAGLFLWMEGGVRSAETDRLTDGSHRGYWTNPDGSAMTFSYSGAFIHLGLRGSRSFFN